MYSITKRKPIELVCSIGIIIVVISMIVFIPNLAAKSVYDLVIKNGRVIDPETGLDANRWIGINSGKIAKISEVPISGSKYIDATGQVVAPGFIDLHAHGQSLPTARLKAFDGITTVLELESGVLHIDKFYKNVAKEGRPINYGASASWAMARASVLDNATFKGEVGEELKILDLPNWTTKIATKEQVKKILALTEKEINKGALGIGVLLGYSINSGHKEYYQLHKLAAQYDVPTFNHIRYLSNIEPRSSYESYQELISVAASTGAHAHISHLNSTSLRDIEDISELIKNAQKHGVNISVEAYPYAAGSTGIGSQMFKVKNWKQRMGNMKESDFSFQGKVLNPTSFKELQEKDPNALVIIRFLDLEHSERDKELYEIAQLFPHGAVASDGLSLIDSDGQMLEGDVWPIPDNVHTHPRSAGAFTRFIRQFVKERKKISLLEAIRKTSLIPAKILEKSTEQMRYKGRIQEGADADIIVFNLAELTDKATFESPTLKSQGMSHVIVNGVLIIEKGQLIRNAMPGQVIRRK